MTADGRSLADRALSDFALEPVLDLMPGVVIVKDRELRYRFANRYYLEANGFKPEDIIGRTARDVFGDARAAEMEILDLEVLNSNAPVPFYETEHGTPDSEPRIFWTTKSPLRDATGQVTHVLTLGLDITPLKRTERALVRSESQSRMILDTIPARVALIDRDRRHRYVNRHYLSLLARSIDEVIGRTVEEILGPDTFAQLAALGERALSGEVVTWSGWVDYPVGRRYVTRVYAPAHDRDGKIDGYFIFVHDITDEIEGRRRLEDTERLLKAVIDAVPATLHVKDREGRYLLVNRFFCNAWGKTPDELIGRSAAEIFGEDDESVPRDLAVLESGQSLPFYEVEYPESDSRAPTILTSKVPLTDDKGRVERIVTVGIDITERKEAELRLQESERLKSSVIESALDCIVAIDEEGQVVEFNPAATATLGFTREEAIGQKVDELIIPHEYRERHRQGLKRFLQTGEARVIGRRVEMEALCRNGSVIPVEITICEIPQGDRRLFTAFLRDLTAAREAETEIQRHRERIHQNEKLAALGSLLAGVSHELNNPLSVVVGRAMMLESTVKDPAAQDSLRRLRQAADRCARIVKTFLAMARQSAPKREPVDPAAVIEAALDLTAYGLRSDGVMLTKSVATRLPTILGDQDQLVQILVNLIINAQQAMMKQDRVRQILVTARPSNDRSSVEIRVSDTGHGIPDDIRGRIFEPFFTTKAFGVGTGIGLSVSLGLAQAHGGSLAIDSTGPDGTTFVLTLPATDDMPAAAAAEIEHPIHDARARVLIIDDEREVAELLGDIVSTSHDVELAYDGLEGLKLASAKRYDAILCDLRMPGLDGLSIYRRLLESHPDKARRMIFVSGDVLGSDAQHLLGGIERPLVEKPFDPATILKLVAETANAG